MLAEDCSYLLTQHLRILLLQDVAERIGREALLHLFAPRVMAMDSYDVTGLPTEQLVVFVAATAGQVRPDWS